MSNNFEIINDFNHLVNTLYEINNSDVLYTNEFNLPVSNKYYLTILNQEENFKKFFEFIFDNTRTKDRNFVLEKEANANLDWEVEQFYMINLHEKNVYDLDQELDELKNVISESKTKLNVVIDINYLINFIKEFADKFQQTHIFDLLLFKLKKIPIEKIIIYDSENKYQKNNLLYEQISYILLKKKNTIEMNREFKFCKKIDESELDIYWKILNHDNYKIEKEIEMDDNNNINENYYLGTINDEKYYISNTYFFNLRDKNIFELSFESGIVIDPIDKINYLI
jgi:hypothetical protein